MAQSRPQQEQAQQADSVSGAQAGMASVTCAICGAGFAPSKEHEYLLHVAPEVLESAFMSVCHFCFRCRRAACPECWDSVHGICGACVQEVGLVFRTEPAPLQGLLFPPVNEQYIQAKDALSPFTCVHPGRFQAAKPPVASVPQTPVVMPEKKEQATSAELVTPSTNPDSLPTGAVPLEASSSEKQANDEGSGLVKRGAGKRILKVVERTLTVIVLLILLAIAALIALAEVSPTANAEIARFLHVDIRGEIGYLISVVKGIL